MRTVQVTGSNLFAVAASELGDATQWYRLAMINRLSDPLIFGITMLLIPPIDTTLGGGIPAQ